jgi:hypothetical protein
MDHLGMHSWGKIMKRILLIVGVGVGLAFPTNAQVTSGTDVPLQLGFLFVNHYGADLKALEARAAWVSEYDLAVALQLASISRTKLDEIISWRREGSSWDAITRRCQLGCEVYFIELSADVELSAPYARPYAVWDETPGADQRLTDEEIRELVLMAALSKHCKIEPEQVVRLRMAGQTPRAIVALHRPDRDIEYATPPVPGKRD